MKKKLSFKHLFSLAWSDLTENVIDWLFLFGMQIASFCLISLVGAVLWMFSLWSFADGFSRNLCTAPFSIAMLAMILLFFMGAALIYPIMNRQNALDIAFKRPMSGFDVNNRFFTFALAMTIYGIIVGLTVWFFFLGLFLAQRWRFVGLHLLEHGGSIRQAFKASWRMTRGCVWFFIGISIIEWLLTLMIGWTIIGYFIVIVMSYLIDAHIYKQLHMEMDQDIETCSSCEN